MSSAAVHCDSAVSTAAAAACDLENARGSETLHVVQSIGVGEYEREVGSHGPGVENAID